MTISCQQRAFLIATAVTLQLAESFIPYFFPGARLGLANMIVLVCLNLYGPGVAGEVALLRPILGALFQGNLLSPTFFFSFCGSLSGWLVMSVAFLLFHRQRVFSNYGISVLGAIGNNFGQLFLAYFWIIPTKNLLWFWPILLLLALGSGLINARVADYVLSRLGQVSLKTENFLSSDGESGRIVFSDTFRIFLSITGLLFSIFCRNWRIYLGLTVILLGLTVTEYRSVRPVVARYWRLFFLLLFSLAMPFFSRWPFFRQALPLAVLIVSRMIFLIALSLWISQLGQKRLSTQIGYLLGPLRFFPPLREIPELFSQAFGFVPAIWEKIGQQPTRNPRKIIDRVVDLFSSLS